MAYDRNNIEVETTDSAEVRGRKRFNYEIHKTYEKGNRVAGEQGDRGGMAKDGRAHSGHVTLYRGTL